MVWSAKMDLLALSNSKGEVALHRLTWQRVWSLAPPAEDVKVTSIAWRPDGKLIAITYQNCEVFLVDVENKEVVHKHVLPAVANFLVWSSEQESTDTTSNSTQDLFSDYVPKLPSLSRSNFGSTTERSGENIEDSKKIKDQHQLNFLLIGLENGLLFLSVFGLFPCGTINTTNIFGQNNQVSIVAAEISQNLKTLYIVASIKENNAYNLKVACYDSEILASRAKELHTLALKYGHIISLQDYLTSTMNSITESWENILLSEMELKFQTYAEQDPQSSISAELLELLMFGTFSEQLERFLLNDLTEKGIKKLGHSIELSHSNIQKLILKHIHTVGQSLAFHLAELKGMALLKDRFSSLGLDQRAVSNAFVAAGSFLVKATEVQLVIDDSMKIYKAFFRWLYAVILHLIDERIPDLTLTDVNQQDLSFIADYLYSLGDFQPTKTDRESTVPKSRCSLDRLGQYLVDKPLTQTYDSKKNSWEMFLAANPCLAEHPTIIPRQENFSLVQQHKHFEEAIKAVFDRPSSSISSLFSISKVIDVSTVQQLSKFSLIHLHDESNLLVAFLKSDLKHFYFMKIPSEKDKKPQGVCVFFNSTDATAKLKILDVQFYLPETLSVLVENNNESRNAIFVQFPTKLLLEYSSVVLNFQQIPTIAANSVLEQSSFRPIENLVASRFAVSGSRKVAVILSESLRKVRLFEMEVEDEEEDEDNLRESDQSTLDHSKNSTLDD